MPVEHISLMPASCLCLKILANVLLITAQPIRIVDASVRRNEQMGVLIAGFPCPLSLTPLPFSLPTYPLPLLMSAMQASADLG